MPSGLRFTRCTLFDQRRCAEFMTIDDQSRFFITSSSSSNTAVISCVYAPPHVAPFHIVEDHMTVVNCVPPIN